MVRGKSRQGFLREAPEKQNRTFSGGSGERSFVKTPASFPNKKAEASAHTPVARAAALLTAGISAAFQKTHEAGQVRTSSQNIRRQGYAKNPIIQNTLPQNSINTLSGAVFFCSNLTRPGGMAGQGYNLPGDIPRLPVHAKRYRRSPIRITPAIFMVSIVLTCRFNHFTRTI